MPDAPPRADASRRNELRRTRALRLALAMRSLEPIARHGACHRSRSGPKTKPSATARRTGRIQPGSDSVRRLRGRETRALLRHGAFHKFKRGLITNEIKKSARMGEPRFGESPQHSQQECHGSEFTTDHHLGRIKMRRVHGPPLWYESNQPPKPTVPSLAAHIVAGPNSLPAPKRAVSLPPSGYPTRGCRAVPSGCCCLWFVLRRREFVWAQGRR